jgi:hypothetical protein
MRSLELLLLHPLTEAAQRAPDAGLRRLLSRSRMTATATESIEAVLLSHFGVARQRDWPAAAFCRVGDGAEPDRAVWICADPVHLRVDRDALVLIDAGRFDLGIEQAQALVLSLNEYFGDDLVFDAPIAKHWYARLQRVPDIETVPLREAVGRNVAPLLPHGRDALAWHRRFNEIQMLLHQHPVNQARDQNGKMSANSVWFWGAGTLPEQVDGAWAHIWSRDSLASGLAKAAGIPLSPLPRTFDEWIAQSETGQHLMVLAEAEPEVGQEWIERGVRALRLRAISALKLTVSWRDRVCTFELTRSDLWRFWRRAAA